MGADAGRVFALTAPWCFDGEQRWSAGGGILVRGARILRVLESRRAVQRHTGGDVPRVEAPGGLLMPGFVVAHTHLELSALAGRVPPGPDFTAWIEALIRARSGCDRARLYAARQAAAVGLLANGATAIGDVDSLDLWREVPRGAPRGPRTVVQREVLDAGDSQRTAAALARVARRIPATDVRSEGIAPHAPYTVTDGLLAGVGKLAARRQLPIAVHWAETREEIEWLAGRGGPFERLLGPSRPQRSSLERLEAAALLGPRTALIHGNHPGPSEMERIRRAGASVVHCPGAHAFFGRERFPLETWLAAGVSLAFGTDSAAGNHTLDPRRELRLAAAAAPTVDPVRLAAIATSGGARALGLAGQVGRFVAGAFADAVVWDLAGDDADSVAGALVHGAGGPAEVWLGGQRIP